MGTVLSILMPAGSLNVLVMMGRFSFETPSPVELLSLFCPLQSWMFSHLPLSPESCHTGSGILWDVENIGQKLGGNRNVGTTIGVRGQRKGRFLEDVSMRSWWSQCSPRGTVFDHSQIEI